MIVLRILGTIVAGLLALAATFGFATQRTLDDREAFTTAMTSALDDAAMTAEIKGEVAEEVGQALDRLSDSGGTLAQLGAALGSQAVEEQVVAVVDTPVFRKAWQDWSGVVFDGLVAAAQGRTDPDVSVSGSTLTIAIQPLLQPVFGEGLAGGAVRLLEFVDADAVVEVHTGVPLARILKITGTLAEWRWGLLVAAATVATLVMLSRRWAIWGAVVFAWTAGLCGGAGWLVRTGQQQPLPGSDYPQVSKAIANAATVTWDNLLFAVAGACVAVAGILLILAALTRTGRRAAPAAP